MLKPFKLLYFFLAISSGFSQTNAIELLEPPKLKNNQVFIKTNRGEKLTTIIPPVQKHLNDYIKHRGNPISSVVILDVDTGHVLAMAEGMKPDKWGSEVSHTALHPYFPAASLFKTVVAAAAIEVLDYAPLAPRGLYGGCGNVNPSGRWMTWRPRGLKFNISLKRAYGHSCNGFFAKLAVNEVGYGAILRYADAFGWEKNLAADFNLPISPLDAPDPQRSSTHTIGKFAAGFGHVGSSPLHAAWRVLSIAADGHNIPIKLFPSKEPILYLNDQPPNTIQPSTAHSIRQLMAATVRGGTATSTFRKRRFRRLRSNIGGKTGTLTGSRPKGLTTWLTLVYPLHQPKIAVAAMTIIEDRWIFKATGLAAEAVWSWKKWEKTKKKQQREWERKQKIDNLANRAKKLNL